MSAIALPLKQNSFDDFLAAAEGLIASGYTRPARLAIAGRATGPCIAAEPLPAMPY